MSIVGTTGPGADVEVRMSVNTSHPLDSHPLAAHPLATRHVLGGLTRRQVLAGLVAAPAVAAAASVLAACGDPNVEPAGTDGAPTTTPGSTPGSTPDTSVPAEGAIAHPTGADVAIIRYGAEGGFVAPETLFVNVPSLVVSGDGRAFVPGAVPAIYPGPLLLPMGVRTISEAGIQRLLALALNAGLLAPPPDYSAEMMVADAPDTVVRFTVGAGTFEHRAYALGFGVDDQGAPTEEMTPARQALLDYVQALGGLAATVGSALGEETLFEPTEYRLRATPVMEADLAGMDPAPTIVDWPASIGLDLATASDCVRVSADAVGTVFTDADQLTHFRQDDVIYRLAVAGVLPGDPVC